MSVSERVVGFKLGKAETFNFCLAIPAPNTLAHSPSRVAADRLRVLGSVGSRFGLHRLEKQYSIVFPALTRVPEGGEIQFSCSSVSLYKRF